MRLDSLDIKIVGLLQEDARLSYREIAERLGSTNPTISARVRALEDIGLLRGYRAQLDPSVLGGASYVLDMTTQPAAAEAALDRLRAMPGVSSVHLLTGGRLVAHIHLRPPSYAVAHLHQALAEVPGLLAYTATEIIRGHERPLAAELPENVEIPCHQCKGPIHADPIKGKLADRTHVFCCRQCLADFRARFEEVQSAARGKGLRARRPSAAGHGHHH